MPPCVSSLTTLVISQTPTERWCSQIMLFFASIRMINNARMRRSLRKTALGSILFAGAVLAIAVIVEAQQPKKVPRIGFLGAQSPVSSGTRYDAFRKRLTELGYIEGKNIAIEYRYAEGKIERLPDLAADLIRLKVDVIV